MRLGFLRLAATLAWLGCASGAAWSEPSGRVAVIELFTSQGCSSCPPADLIFADLARSTDVIALAYHVDYWDYLGWRDTLGSASNTARQYEYMHAFGGRSVYTPQAVIDGRVHVNGADRSAVQKAISEFSAEQVEVTMKRGNDALVVETGDSLPGTEARLLLISFRPPQTVLIGDGENNGRSMTYWHAVSSIQPAGLWHGAAKRFELPVSGNAAVQGFAVLLQSMPQGKPGPILGAAILRD